MKILFIISWRNIWRNPLRSLAIIASVMAGLWGGIFASAISFGMIQQRFKTSIENHFSHIQIHHPEFIREKNVKYGIPNTPEIFAILDTTNVVKSYTQRTLVNGMISTASLTRGVEIIGIDPVTESLTTAFEQNIIAGDYFESIDRNPVLIGRKLADRLKLEPRSRLVLTFQDIHGNITAASFRVSGIYQSFNSMLEDKNIYVKQSDLSRLLADDIILNEIAILLNDIDSVTNLTETLANEFRGLTVRGWMDISPELSYMHEMSSIMLLVIVIIILFALAFGLVNTMLMSVFERTRELGMLMSVGMNKLKVFTMILLETIYLTLLGSGMAIFASLITIMSLKKTGLDLGKVGGDSMKEFGFDTLIYPDLNMEYFINLIIIVILTAILSSLYPAYKALKLKPAEAVRKE